MVDSSIKHPSTKPPLRLDSSTLSRRSLDISPSQSSVQSSRVHTPSSSVPSTPVVSARAPSPEKKPLHPADSNTFLTALAAQERRVLELKEELQKAEGELDQLKKQWASHEAAKKRNELRHLEQLQPLKTSMNSIALSRESELSPVARDSDQRKMPPPPSAKPSQRTVFSGSRHVRTLSLLSPKEPLAGSSVPTRGQGTTKRSRELVDTTKAPTIHDLSSAGDASVEIDAESKNPPKDLILETGKQLVGDFRQGLWTFFEDLKQVTVGDEAASAPDSRHQHSMPAENLPKAQIRKKRVSNVKKSPVSETTISENAKRESSQLPEITHEIAETQRSSNLPTPNNTNVDSSELDDDDDDDGC